MLKSEKLIFDLIQNNEIYRRYSFINSGNYFDLVFLCGKKLEPNDNRTFIKERIIEKNKKIAVLSELLYKEFSDLDEDLLKIEEILFDISSAIILIVESYGSACELGAFSLIDKNIEKLTVINNKEFEGKGSFIEDGPIKKILSSYPNNVLYKNFNDDGIVDFDADLISKLSLVGRKSFSRECLKFNGSVCVINDLSFITCLFFDYILKFGLIVKGHAYKVLKNIYASKGINDFIIALSSSNFLDDPNKVALVLEKILTVMVKSELLLERKNGKYFYYVINFPKLKKLELDPFKFDSFIFRTSFLNTKFTKLTSKIKNIEKKEGFELW